MRPVGCGRDSRAIDFRSHRCCFREHPGAEFAGRVFRGEDVHGYAQKVFKLDLQSAKVEQRGAREGVDQKVEVTVIPISAMQHGTEDTWVGGAKTADGFADGRPVPIKCYRWFHGLNSRITPICPLRQGAGSPLPYTTFGHDHARVQSTFSVARQAGTAWRGSAPHLAFPQNFSTHGRNSTSHVHALRG